MLRDGGRLLGLRPQSPAGLPRIGSHRSALNDYRRARRPICPRGDPAQCRAHHHHSPVPECRVARGSRAGRGGHRPLQGAPRAHGVQPPRAEPRLAAAGIDTHAAGRSRRTRCCRRSRTRNAGAPHAPAQATIAVPTPRLSATCLSTPARPPKFGDHATRAAVRGRFRLALRGQLHQTRPIHHHRRGTAGLIALNTR